MQVYNYTFLYCIAIVKHNHVFLIINSIPVDFKDLLNVYVPLASNECFDMATLTEVVWRAIKEVF